MFVLRAEASAENGNNFRTYILQTYTVQNLQTAQDYIFQALQHFATKCCNYINFIMLFLAVVFDSLLFT
jgi:hypothetical protein